MNIDQLKAFRKETSKLITLQRRAAFRGGCGGKWQVRAARKRDDQFKVVTRLALDLFDRRSPILERATSSCMLFLRAWTGDVVLPHVPRETAATAFRMQAEWCERKLNEANE